jgi:hypothetical protein
MTAETIEVITDPQTELDRFKQQVRRLAIQVHHDEGWCIDGLNDGLDELGLARYAGKPRLIGTARLTATVAWPRNVRVAQRSALTVDTVGNFLRATSTDYDVRLRASRVTAFAIDGQGGTVTVEATVEVREIRDQEIATRWVSGGLTLSGTLRVAALTVDDITFTGEESDPDEPGSY